MLKWKKILSIIVAVILIINILPVNVFAEQEDSTALVNNDEYSVEGTNSFGTLLATEIDSDQEDANQDEYKPGYAVTDITVEGNTATVVYDSMEEAILVVAVYSEEMSQMIASGNVKVNPDETEANVIINGTMPEYFLVSAFLLNTYDYSPLCKEYDTPMYTREMQELLASTVEDYEEEKVFNLDEDSKTNFAVYADTTIVIPKPAKESNINTVKSVDEENKKYVIGNADQSFLNMKPGDIFAYEYSDDNVIFAKIKEISVDGTDVVIIGDDLELEEVFQVAKIEGEKGTADMTVNAGTADENVVYEGVVKDGAQTYSLEGGVSADNEWHKFSTEIKSGTGDGSSSKISFKMKMKVELEYYLSFKHNFLKFKYTPELDFNVDAKFKLEISRKLGSLGVNICPGVYVGFEPKLELKFDAAVNFNINVKSTIGFAFDSDSGFKNISSVEKPDLELKLQGMIFFGVNFAPHIAILSDKVADAELKSLVGVEVKGTTSGMLHELYHKNEDSYHQCSECIDIRINFIAELGGSLKFVDSEKVKFTVTIGKWSKEVGRMYYSLDTNKFGEGGCPNYLYKITFVVTDENGEIVSNKKIHLGGSYEDLVTNENGVAACYMPYAEYYASVVFDKMTVTKQFKVDCSQRVDISANAKINKDGINGVLGNVNKKEITDHGTKVDSGACGETLYWDLYQDGFMYIYGSGEMNGDSFAPDLKKKITGVEIENGCTSIRNSAFEGCSKLKKIEVPETVKTIGSSAFKGCGAVTAGPKGSGSDYEFGWTTTIPARAFYMCTSLTTVSLPDSLNTIEGHAFYGCDSMKTITIPNQVESIGTSSFGNCDSLIEAVIPDSVTRIDSSAFSSCKGLKKVQIGSGVTTMNSSAFSNCSELETVIFKGSAPSIASSAFQNVVATVYYPEENGSWIVSVRKDYGGTLTWVPYSSAVDTSLTSMEANYDSNNAESSSSDKEEVSENKPTEIMGEEESDENETIETPREEENSDGNEATENEDTHLNDSDVADDEEIPIETEVQASDDVETLKNIVGGDYSSEQNGGYSLKRAYFRELVPGEQYVLLALVNVEVEDLLTEDNILYICQGEALNDGTLEFEYVQREETSPSYVIACGASNKNVKDAEIAFPKPVANEELQIVNPVVKYDGETLVAGRDYTITGAVSYIEAGTYKCAIQGIRNYAGEVECTYEVLASAYDSGDLCYGDVNRDGVVDFYDISLLNKYRLGKIEIDYSEEELLLRADLDRDHDLDEDDLKIINTLRLDEAGR